MTTFKKLSLTEFWCCFKEEYSQCSENVLEMNIFFSFSDSDWKCFQGFPGKESAYQCRRHGFHPWSGRIPHVVQQLRAVRLLSQGAAAAAPTCPGGCALQQEKLLQWEARAPRLESSPCSRSEGKAPAVTKAHPAQPKKMCPEQYGWACGKNKQKTEWGVWQNAVYVN